MTELNASPYLGNQLKVKYLEINWPLYERPVCQASMSLCRFFIQQKSSDLVTFTTDDLLRMEEIRDSLVTGAGTSGAHSV